MGAKGFYSSILFMDRNISELIIMKMHCPMIKTHTILRMILSAGVLAVLVFSGADVASCTDYRCTQAAEVAA